MSDTQHDTPSKEEKGRMLLGEAMTQQQRNKFDLAALTFFVEQQKLHGFSRETRGEDMSEALEMALMYVNALECTYDLEMHEVADNE